MHENNHKERRREAENWITAIGKAGPKIEPEQLLSPSADGIRRDDPLRKEGGFSILMCCIQIRYKMAKGQTGTGGRQHGFGTDRKAVEGSSQFSCKHFCLRRWFLARRQQPQIYSMHYSNTKCSLPSGERSWRIKRHIMPRYTIRWWPPSSSSMLVGMW